MLSEERRWFVVSAKSSLTRHASSTNGMHCRCSLHHGWQFILQGTCRHQAQMLIELLLSSLQHFHSHSSWQRRMLLPRLSLLPYQRQRLSLHLRRWQPRPTHRFVAYTSHQRPHKNPKRKKKYQASRPLESSREKTPWFPEIGGRSCRGATEPSMFDAHRSEFSLLGRHWQTT